MRREAIAYMTALSHTTWGKTEIIEERTAPAPIATSAAGIAQQTSVLDVVSSDTTELQSPPRVWAIPSSII